MRATSHTRPGPVQQPRPHPDRGTRRAAPTGRSLNQNGPKAGGRSVANRTQEFRSGSVGNTGTIDYAYNSADQLSSTTKSGASTTYSYDANGNLAGKGSRSFSYDLANRLASTTASGTTTTYGYDGDNRRITSTSGGANLRLTWDPLADAGIPELALERDNSGNLVRRYLNGPAGALSMTSSAGTFAYHHDPLGTVTDQTDTSGSAQWRYSYDAYGNPLSTTDVSGTAPENRLRFNSQYLDTETADYYLRARQYDPSAGRFGALDPVENPMLDPYGAAYGYGSGRPLYFVDPLGLFGWHDVVSVAAGAADTLTLSISTRVLESSGIDVDTESNYFRGGQIAGSFVGPGGASAFVARRAAEKGLGWAARAGVRAAMGGSTAVATGATRAAISGQPYGADQAAVDSLAGAVGAVAFGALIRRCSSPVSRAAEAGRPASSAVSGKLLGRQLASEEQVAGRGTPIIGAGTRGKLRDAERLAREYGGDPADWAKMSSGRYRGGGGLYDVFETHWYENVRTGAKHEFKTKFPRAGNAFGSAGG